MDNVTRISPLDRANAFLEKYINGTVLLSSFFNEQGNEDFYIQSSPGIMTFTYGGEEYGHEFFVSFEFGSFSFCEKDYSFIIDENNNYISFSLLLYLVVGFSIH